MKIADRLLVTSEVEGFEVRVVIGGNGEYAPVKISSAEAWKLVEYIQDAESLRKKITSADHTRID